VLINNIHARRFLRADGERYVIKHGWGRADHRHEGQARAKGSTARVVMNRRSALAAGFRMVSVSSVQRQWWFQEVPGCFRAGG
jgi:hypothetical protein